MPSPLRNIVYRRLFLAQVVALAGSGLSTIALALLAYELAGKQAGAVLGTALMIKMIAAVGIPTFAAGLTAKIPRKKLLILLDVFRAAFVICFPLITEVWQIYLLIFLLNGCSAVFTPTFQATLPDILPDEDEYTRALSLSRLAYDLENLLSPMVAAAALLVLRFDALFVATAVGFVFSALLVSSVELPPRKVEDGAQGLWDKATFGIQIYVKTPRLRALLILSFAVAAAGAMVIINTVLYVQNHLGGTQAETAFVLAASGAGSMLIALLLPKLLENRSDRGFMLLGGGLLGCGLLLGLTMPDFLGLLPIWFLLGAGSSLVQTPTGRLLVRSASESDRSQIYAAHYALSHACWLVAYPLAGFLGSKASFFVTFAALASIAFVATLAAVVLWPSHDPVELEHEHHHFEHEHLHVHDEHHQHTHEGWEGPEPHCHPHTHTSIRHKHPFVIDKHHPIWPRTAI